STQPLFPYTTLFRSKFTAIARSINQTNTAFPMELQLTKPICFFDLETTGTNVAKDRIVETSILKVHPNGNRESRTYLVNPEMPRSEEHTSELQSREN